MANTRGLFGAFGRNRPVSPFPEVADPNAAMVAKPTAAPGADTPPTQRRGLFGRAFSPDRLMILGAALQQAGGRDGALTDMLQMMQQSQLQQSEQQWMEEQRGRMRGQWGAQDRYSASLPEGQRDAFAMDPAGYVGQQRGREQYQWQHEFDESNPDSITPFQQAQLDLTRRGQDISARANGGGGQGAVPAGYRRTPDGNLEAIPGGPADIRATAAGQARAGRLQASATSLANAVQVLNRAEGMVSNDTAGVWANRTREWGLNQGATDLNEALEPVRAILSFENLAEMRRNSETGGALGSIAVRELDLLGSTIRSLSTAQSPASMRQAIIDTRTQLQTTMAAVVAAQREAAGTAGQSQPGQPAQPQGGGQRLRFNPQTGRLE